VGATTVFTTRTAVATGAATLAAGVTALAGPPSTRPASDSPREGA
jgi:hypothetical protein